MIAFESYKNNLDVIDKFNIQSVILSKGIVCGDITTAVKKKYHDVDPEFPPLASAVIGPNNTAATTVKESSSTTLKHSWVDIDTQQEYLESKPTCFLILSKPGAGAYHLGEAMAKYYKCIHVCPRNVLIDEMEQKSDTGKCIDYNMKHNNVMKASIILPIIKEKLKSPTVMHRGYVLSGLPLISTDKKPNTFIYSLNSEESIIIVGEILFIALCEVFKKKEKKKIRDSETDSVNTLLQEEQLEANLEEEEEESPEEQKAPMEAVEEEDETVELPKFVLNTCDDIIHYRKTYLDTKQNVLLRQLSDIFNLDLTPDLIIYITSPDADLITKKYHKFHNYKSNINFADTFSVKKETEIRWPLKYPLKDYYEHIDNTVLATKYICRQPMNFRENSVEQMCNYRKLVLPFIENKLNDYSPKHIIKIDARTAVHEMMHQIMKILRLLPIVKPVIIPEPLYMAEPPEDLAEFWKYIDETNFVKMGKTKFSRYPSPWYNRCPVELKKGRCLLGKIKFAVQFFKHVYLLSSHEALITFYSNPRPYLHLKYLEPTCRIFVLGTKSSGKTMVAQCLSWIFDSPIIKFTEIVDKWKKSRLDAMMSKVFPEIFPLIEQAREGQWQIIEGNRITELNNWHSNCLADLKKYVVYAGAYKTIQEKEAQAQALEAEKRQKKEQENLERGIFKPLPKPKPPVQSKQDKKIISGYNEILEKMQEINLPEDLLEDLDECRNILMIKDMYKYAPEKYLAVTETPAVPLLEDDDVQKSIWEYIEENDLRNELETTPEEVVGEISQIILSIDKETEEKTNFDKSFGQYIVDGFPSEPEYWEIISKSKLLPDHTIAIMENRELDIDLIKHYKFLLDCSKHYEDRFACADDPLIKIKVMTKELAGKCRPFEHIPSKRNSMDEEEEEDTDFSVPFTQELDNFFDNWDNLKMRLEDNKKLYIEVSLENMSDIDVMENVLIKLRQNYYIPIPSSDDENAETAQDEESEEPQDMVTYNHPVFLCETGPYCPIAYYDHGVLWEGKSDFSFKYDNKMHYFCKQECMDKFKIDVTKYQAYNKPYKKLPPLRICLIGCNGYGRSSAGKYIAKELGVIHVDFLEFINHHLLPRHFKRVGLIYENVFKDVPFDEKTVKDFQTDEDSQNIDPMTDEMELRSMVFEYYERGSPLLSPLLQKLLKRIWFAEPFVSTGFVLDGFPRVPSDVEDMTALFCVPDVVIDLEGSSELSLERVVPYFFNIWKTQQNEEKLKNKIKMDKLRHNWLDFITKKVVVKLLIDEVIENAVSLAQEQVFTEVASTESAVIDPQPNLSGTMDMGENLFNAYNEIIEEYPEPIDESEWEEADEAKERIGARMESIHDSEEENLDEVKDLLTDQGIKIIAVDASKTPHKVWRRALINLTNYRNRTTSFFEQTFVVSCDVAEVLIAEGFCFLSKFHRLCPVHLYENPQIILNPHEQNRRNNTLYPVVHRSFIYYINGEEALKNFRLDPLLYVPNRNVASSHEYTLRIGIVGPPKSGKSTLAAKVSKKYGLKCISRGNALRNILQNLYWTKLGTRLKSSLESGGCVKTDDIVEAVHMALIDHHTVSCGFVLDGFPETPSEAMELHKLASRVPVPDERFDYLCEYHKPASKVPAFLNVVDIAGLVRGAAEGQGLGNAFLSHIKACDAIFNLCRAFDDEDVIHVDGEVNPVRDLETIGEELRLKDVETLTQTVDKLDRQVNRGGDKKLKPEYDSLTKIKAILVDEKKHTRFGDWSAADIEVLNKYLFLTSKPALYLVNLSEKDYIRKKNKWLPKLKEWIDKNDPGAPLIPFSGVLESKLMDMDAEEKKAFLKEHNITSALDKIIVQGYKALHLEYFFTAGADEVKAWTIQKGTKAPQAAGRIHTDFEKGFIMAEVMHYKDFKEEGTEASCKSAGKYRQQGRNYMVEDGDIIFFKFNAGAGLKDAKKK